jgi:hypothetical protein
MSGDQEDQVAAGPGALQATLGLVLRPYAAAYHATAFAVAAPLKISKHVIASAWNAADDRDKEQEEDASDLFGERADRRATSEISAGFASSERSADLFGEDSDVDEQETDEEQQSGEEEQVVTVVVEDVDTPQTPGAVAQLLFLPVRIVSSGMSTAVSTAVSMPAHVVHYSGQKLVGAVSTSQSLASSAIGASTSLVARTSLHVANGALSTAAFTAHKLTGAVGSSMRGVRYVIPPSVANAVWQGLGATGNASASVISLAIAVPSYRMLQALVPEVSAYFSEQDAVSKTKDAVLLLVKVLGPQNAFRVLKFMYETVNSEEAHDAFLLCHDLVREALDGENYRSAGTSVRKSTGVDALVPVVKEVYNLLPSLDDMLDAVAFVEDVSKEVTRSLETRDDSSRFEYIDSEEDMAVTEAFNGEEDQSPAAEITYEEDAMVDGDIFTDSEWSVSNDELDDAEVVVAAAAEAANAVVETGISLLTSVSDSDEVASLFNAFGDFLDVLVN